MNHDNDHAAWINVTLAGGFWLIGHITLSNLALCVSIAVGVLQGYKTWREIRRTKGKP
jgi:hypothetical protein